MPTVKFLIQSKKSSAPIYLRLSLNRTSSYKRKTGFHINPNDWNQKKGFPKNKIDAKHTGIILSLQKLESFILNEVNNSNSEGIKIDGIWIEEKINQCFKRNNSKEDKQTVSYVINEIIKNAKSRDNGKGSLGLSKSRIQSYKRLDSLYNEFKGKQNFNIQDLDYKKFNEFKNWLFNSKNYAVTYSLKKLSDLKTVCKEAKKIGIPISNEIEGIKTKQGNAYDDDMDVIALSFDEINKIQKLNIQNESLENARKWLII